MDYDVQKFARDIGLMIAKEKEKVAISCYSHFIQWIGSSILFTHDPIYLATWSEFLKAFGNLLKITELPDEAQEVLDYIDEKILEYLNGDFLTFGERVAKSVNVNVIRADGPPEDPGPCPEDLSVEEAKEWFEKKLAFDCYRMLIETPPNWKKTDD